MTLGHKLKSLRRELGLSQEALGGQGFVSTPGWIKIENGQRRASEKLLEGLVRWLVQDKYLRPNAAGALKEELFTLRYLGSRSAFVRDLARAHAKVLPDGGAAVLAEIPAVQKAKRGRPSNRQSTRGLALAAETPGVYKAKRLNHQ